MKKTYIKPETQTFSVRTMMMIAASNGDAISTNLLEDVSYGGIDEEGEMDPSSRRNSIWDDDEENE